MILPRLRSMKYELSIYETVSIFDLPTITAQDKREYRAFRKLLIKNGFL